MNRFFLFFTFYGFIVQDGFINTKKKLIKLISKNVRPIFLSNEYLSYRPTLFVDFRKNTLRVWILFFSFLCKCFFLGLMFVFALIFDEN